MLGWMDGNYLDHRIVDEIERTTTANAHQPYYNGELAEEGEVWCSEPRRLLEAPWLVVTSRQFRLEK
jgi:hypothetical protein